MSRHGRGEAARLVLAALVLALSFLDRALGQEPAGEKQPPAKAQPVELRWKFAEGDDLRYSIRITQKTSAPGAPQATGSEQLLTVHWKVAKRLDDGSASMVCRFTAIRASFDSPVSGGAKVQYDSQEQKKLDGPLAGLNQLFDTMMSTEFSFQLSPTGEVSQFKIPDAALKTFSRLAATGGFGQSASKEAIAALATTPVVSLPKESIAAGARWQSVATSTFPGGVEMKETTELTLATLLKVRGRNTARFQLVPRVDRGAAKQPVAPVRLIGQSGQGAVDFDCDGGHTTRLTGAQRLEVELTPFAGAAVKQVVLHEVSVKKLGNMLPQTAGSAEEPQENEPGATESKPAEVPLKMPDP